MPKCEYCEKEVDFPFQCSFCGFYFCTEHRLPENHDCPNQPTRSPLGRWKAKLPKVPKGKVKERIREEGEFYFIKESPKTRKRKAVETPTISSSTSKNTSVPSEGKLHFVKGEKTPKPKKSVKRIVAVSLLLIILGVLLWYSPTIISMFQNLLSQNSVNPDSSQLSYTKLTLIKSSSSFPNFTCLTFGEVDYFFDYSWQDFLLVSNSLLETKSYQPTNGSVYKEIGVEMKVSEMYSNRIVLLVKPIVQDYLAQSSFKKMTIAQGQYQAVDFGGNEYTLSYLQNPPYYVNKLIVSTPLLQSREYDATGSQIINCDLGLEIRVYKATSEYIIIFVKSTF